jgi:hypothetical protein
MDQLVQLNAGFSEFDREVAEQLWEHTTKNPEGRVLLKDYIQTIIDARSILKENIDKCSSTPAFMQNSSPTNRTPLNGRNWRSAYSPTGKTTAFWESHSYSNNSPRRLDRYPGQSWNSRSNRG